MRPLTWHPSVEISSLERNIINRIKRAKLFVFLRYRCHELFDDAFQEELAGSMHQVGVGSLPFRLRRCAVVHNLHVLARSQPLQADLQNAA